MIGKYSYCDILNVVKLFIGIGLLGAGLYQWNIFGLIGLIPIVQFFQYCSNPVCAIPTSKAAKEKSNPSTTSIQDLYKKEA